MSSARNDIGYFWLFFQSENAEMRRLGGEGYIALLNSISEQEFECDEGGLSFLYDHPEFLRQAESYFRSDDPAKRKDGGSTLSAIMNVAAWELDDNVTPLNFDAVDKRAIELFLSEDDDAIIDGSVILLSGHELLATESERARQFAANSEVCARAADLYYESPNEFLGQIASDMLIMLASGDRDSVKDNGTINRAVINLTKPDEHERKQAMHLLECFIGESEDVPPYMAQHPGTLLNTLQHYTSMPVARRSADGTKLLLALACEDQEKSRQIAEYPGFLERATKRVEGYPMLEDVPDEDTVSLIVLLARNGQSEIILTRSNILPALLKLYSLTNREALSDLSYEEQWEIKFAGRSEINYGIDPICALIEGGPADRASACEGLISTAVEMLGCNNGYANEFGYELLDTLIDHGQKDAIVRQCPDIEERMKAYADAHIIPSYPLTKDASPDSPYAKWVLGC